MGKVVTNGEIAIGYEYFTLGTFANEVNAEFFVDKLAEMTRAKNESALAEKGGAE